MLTKAQADNAGNESRAAARAPVAAMTSVQCHMVPPPSQEWRGPNVVTHGSVELVTVLVANLAEVPGLLLSLNRRPLSSTWRFISIPIVFIVVPFLVNQKLYYRILAIKLVNPKKELQWRLWVGFKEQ